MEWVTLQALDPERAAPLVPSSLVAAAAVEEAMGGSGEMELAMQKAAMLMAHLANPQISGAGAAELKTLAALLAAVHCT